LGARVAPRQPRKEAGPGPACNPGPPLPCITVLVIMCTPMAQCCPAECSLPSARPSLAVRACVLVCLRAERAGFEGHLATPLWQFSRGSRGVCDVGAFSKVGTRAICDCGQASLQQSRSLTNCSARRACHRGPCGYRQPLSAFCEAQFYQQRRTAARCARCHESICIIAGAAGRAL
jgi:hypothetical protein